MVVVALLSVDLVESVDLVFVDLVVNCIPKIDVENLTTRDAMASGANFPTPF